MWSCTDKTINNDLTLPMENIHFWSQSTEVLWSRLHFILGADLNHSTVQTKLQCWKTCHAEEFSSNEFQFLYFFKRDHHEREEFFIFGTETQHTNEWRCGGSHENLDLLMNYLKSSARAFGACGDWTRCLVQNGTMSDVYCWITLPCVSLILMFSFTKEQSIKVLGLDFFCRRHWVDWGSSNSPFKSYSL